MLGAEALGDVEALHVGEHHVEHDQLRLEGADGGDRLRAGAGGLDREALEAQGHGDDVDDVRLVVDDEHTVGFGLSFMSITIVSGSCEFPGSPGHSQAFLRIRADAWGMTTAALRSSRAPPRSAVARPELIGLLGPRRAC